LGNFAFDVSIVSWEPVNRLMKPCVKTPKTPLGPRGIVAAIISLASNRVVHESS